MIPAARRVLIALVVVGTAAGWLLLRELPWPARAYTVFLLVPLPAVLLAQARLIRDLPEDAEREGIYVSSAVSVWVLAAFAMVAARSSGMTRSDLRLEAPDTALLLGATGATILAGLAVMAAGRVLRLRESALLDYLIPRTSSEKIAFAGLSVSAGIAEELVFRSFLIATLISAGASLGVAAAVSVAAFAVSHAYQGMSGVIRVGILGLVLTAPYVVTGSVYPSILAHILLDLLTGLVLADWLRGHRV